MRLAVRRDSFWGKVVRAARRDCPPSAQQGEDEQVFPYARIAAALEVARLYGCTDGAHHKMWVIDQMVRALTGGGGGIVGPPTDEYREFVADAEGEWDEGIAP